MKYGENHQTPWINVEKCNKEDKKCFKTKKAYLLSAMLDSMCILHILHFICFYGKNKMDGERINRTTSDFNT